MPLERPGPLALAPIGLAALLTASCSASPVAVSEPTLDQVGDQPATCKVAKDPLNPLIIEWPGTSKIDLDVRSQRGLVAVSYAGCTLKVLPACEIGGGYSLRTVTPARDRFAIETATDLYARLPLGAAALKGELTSGTLLDLDYVAVGQRVAEAAPAAPQGACDGATHYVRTITVGAYALDARASGGASAGVDVAGAGVGASRNEAVKRVRGSGDVDTCASAPQGAGCNAVIQLGLAPLPWAAQAGDVSASVDVASAGGAPPPGGSAASAKSIDELTCWPEAATPEHLRNLPPAKQLEACDRVCLSGKGDKKVAGAMCEQAGLAAADGTKRPRDMEKALALLRRGCEIEHGMSCRRVSEFLRASRSTLKEATEAARKSCELGAVSGCEQHTELSRESALGEPAWDALQACRKKCSDGHDACHAGGASWETCNPQYDRCREVCLSRAK